MDAIADPALFTLPTDGPPLTVRRWDPAAAPSAAVVVVHGMSEHGARYGGLAAALTAAGCVVYAHDQRGHGVSAKGDYGWAGRDGWNAMVADIDRLVTRIVEDHPGIPVVAFGHSMGSMLLQRYLELHGDRLAGAILSGTSGWIPPRMLRAGVMLTALFALGPGARKPSAIAIRTFGEYNKPFAGEHPSGFEWLSRDAAEVQKYVDDPMSGNPVSSRFYADMVRGLQQTWDPKNEAQIPKTLAVLLFSGDRDPVGANGATVTALAERYKALGLRDVRTILYPGGRHEMLNETNRDDVMRDVVGWIASQVVGTR